MNYEHYAGDVYYNGSSEYLLAIVEGVAGSYSKLNLISLQEDNRWDEPIRIDTTDGRAADKLTAEEFEQLVRNAHYLPEEIVWELVSNSRSLH